MEVRRAREVLVVIRGGCVSLLETGDGEKMCVCVGGERAVGSKS